MRSMYDGLEKAEPHQDICNFGPPFFVGRTRMACFFVVSTWAAKTDTISRPPGRVVFNRAADRKQVVQLGFAAVISKYSAPWGQWSSRNLQPLQPNGCRFTPVAVNHPHRDHLEMVGAFWSMRFRIGMTHYDYMNHYESLVILRIR